MVFVPPNQRKYEYACELIRILGEAGYETRLVGGCVRDRYLGIEPKDYDLATVATPEMVKELCEGQQYKVIPTGIEHGTVTVVVQHEAIEVTTLRVDVASDGRWAQVKLGTSFREDAARRDFTMNAMSEDCAGKVYDYFGGRQHLNAGRLVFVGDAEQRIQEDYLRILRFFRFKARFQLHADAPTLDAIKRQQVGLQKISKERIIGEIWGLLSCTQVFECLCEMVDTGTFGGVFSGLDRLSDLKSERHKAIQHEIDSLQERFRPYARLAVCFLLAGSWQQPLPMEQRLVGLVESLRLANNDKAQILWAFEGLSALSRLPSDRAEVFDFIDQCEGVGGKDIFEHLYEPLWTAYLRLAPAPQAQERLDKLKLVRDTECLHGPLRRQPMPVNGKDIMKWTGLAGGPQVGDMLLYLKRQFRNGHWRTREEGQKLLLHYWQSQKTGD